MKKATQYAKESHTSKVILTFSILLFYFIAGRKKFHSCSYLLLKAAAFRLNLLVAFWRTRNNNESTKRMYNTTTAAAANFKGIP